MYYAWVIRHLPGQPYTVPEFTPEHAWTMRTRGEDLGTAGSRWQGTRETQVTRAVKLICLGRAAVDLYGLERGTHLEDAQHFAKYLGGSSGNVAVGLSRLGLQGAC